MIKIGTAGIADVKLGTTQIAKVCAGSNVVWTKGPYLTASYPESYVCSAEPWSISFDVPEEAHLGEYSLLVVGSSRYETSFTASGGDAVSVSVRGNPLMPVSRIEVKVNGVIVVSQEVGMSLLSLSSINVSSKISCSDYDYAVGDVLLTGSRGRSNPFTNEKFILSSNTNMSVKVEKRVGNDLWKDLDLQPVVEIPAGSDTIVYIKDEGDTILQLRFTRIS